MDMQEICVLSLELRDDTDIVRVRQRARQAAAALSLSKMDQTALATATSEVARNAVQYAGGGQAQFIVRQFPQAMLVIKVRDKGRGIGRLDETLRGPERADAAASGLVNAQHLTELFDVQTGIDGTCVTLGKPISRRVRITPELFAELAHVFAAGSPVDPLAELRLQNQDLMAALKQLRIQQSETERLNAELNETNRGVLALYAELDEKAEAIQLASQLKTRFLSHMSHEFRAPLVSLRNISGILLDRVDGALTEGQDTQVRLMRKSADDLLAMVTDLLDLAKIEAGKTTLHIATVAVDDILSALRGMFRPLAPADGKVELIIHDAAGLPPLHTDEGKVSQILRHLVSNGLKFTARGQVTVAARVLDDDTVSFVVADTGIGVAEEHQCVIFQEFVQIDAPAQRRSRGTGLGLPLSQKLARLLGGEISVRSAPDKGSTFTLRIPMRYRAAECDSASVAVPAIPRGKTL